MVVRDVYDIRNTERGSAEHKRAWKHVARTSAALLASFAVNAVAQSFADMYRDDDREKELGEKLTEAYVENLLQNFNAIGYIPYLKDIQSVIQGWTVDQPDMEGLADLVQAIRIAAKTFSGAGGKTELEAGINLVSKALDAFGLPASNIKRDVMGMLSGALQATGAHWATYQIDKVQLTIGDSGNAGVYLDTLYRAMNGDYWDYIKIYRDMVAEGMDPGKIQTAMEKRMAEELGLSSVVMLPMEWHPPGENAEFDAALKRQLDRGRTWTSAVDGQLIELAQSMEELTPEAGKTTVTNRQRRRAIADSGYGENVKEEAMERILTPGSTAHTRYFKARDAGVSTKDYVDLVEAIEAATVERRGESGSASQEDVLKALKRSGLTARQKKAVWYSYGYKSESPWG